MRFVRGRREMGRHTRLGVVALTVGLLTLAACGGGDPDPSSTPGATTDGSRPTKTYKVKVGTLRQPHLFAPAFYAQFLPANVTMETVLFANSTEIKTAVVTGSVDFAVTGITAALEGAAQDEPFRVLASAADGASAIVAKKDSGISTVADLKGKKIGYVVGSAQDILLRLTLQDAGLDANSDVELVKVGFADMANALDRGDIDAFSGAETGPSDALVRGIAQLVVHPYETKMKMINIVFGTSQAMIDKDPELVTIMVATHAKATDYMLAHTDEWAAGVVKAYSFPAEALDLAIKNIQLRWLVDDAYIDQANVLGEQLEALKQIKKQPDYDAFFDTTFVTALMKGG
jgi:NitT/TauT family transport system substrate-binding protein